MGRASTGLVGGSRPILALLSAVTLRLCEIALSHGRKDANQVMNLPYKFLPRLAGPLAFVAILVLVHPEGLSP
ncbi:MAG: hypothetical protein ACI8XO_004645, partial [Verrucomicrobiales bacterium]